MTLADIEDDEVQSETSSVYNVLDLFRYQSLRVGTIGFAVASISIHILYYGGYKCMHNLDNLALI